MTDLSRARIAILSTDGVEQSELLVPRDRLRESGATVEVISPKMDSLKGWNHTDWGEDITVDRPLAEADPAAYGALVLPGGQINPDLLRLDRDALDFILAIHGAGRPIAAICHGPWLLIETGLVAGRKVTSWTPAKTFLNLRGYDFLGLVG